MYAFYFVQKNSKSTIIINDYDGIYNTYKRYLNSIRNDDNYKIIDNLNKNIEEHKQMFHTKVINSDNNTVDNLTDNLIDIILYGNKENISVQQEEKYVENKNVCPLVVIPQNVLYTLTNFQKDVKSLIYEKLSLKFVMNIQENCLFAYMNLNNTKSRIYKYMNVEPDIHLNKSSRISET